MAVNSNGKRIRLRLKRLSDAKEDYSWQVDPELSELDAAESLHMPYEQYVSEYNFELCYPTHNRFEFAIDTLQGEHIGNCVYYNVNNNEGKAEMGIMIGNRRYWDQGYGIEAITLLLDHIFQKTRLERIYLTTLDWNLRAQKCFHKCGFKDCGTLSREKRHFILMVIHHEDWLKLHAAANTSASL